MPIYETGLMRIDMLNANGDLIGGGPLVTAQSLVITNFLDKMGGFSFPVPSTDPRTEFMGVGTRYKFYHKDYGFLGEGIHRSMSVQPGESPVTIVRADNLLRELVNEWVSFNRQFNNVFLGDIAESLVSLVPGWVAFADDVGLTTLEFQGESVLNALVQLAKGGGSHFRLPFLQQRQLQFGDFGTPSGIRVINIDDASTRLEENTQIAIIDNLTILEEGEIINYLIPVASGQGDAQINLKWVVTFDPAYPVNTGVNPDGSNFYYIQDIPSQAAYGVVKRVYRRNDIRPLDNESPDLRAASEALYNAALSFLKNSKDPVTSYRISINRLRAPLLVGQTIRVAFRGVAYQDMGGVVMPYKWVDIDEDLIVLSASATFKANGQTSTVLEVSSNGINPVSDSSFIADMNRDITVMRGNIQPAPNLSKISWLDQLEPGINIEIPVRVRSEVLFINTAILRFETKPLRSTGGITVHRVDPATLNANDIPLYFDQTDDIIKFPSLAPGLNAIPQIRSGIFDDTHYPQNIRLFFNGVDITVAMGGPWALTDNPVTIDDLDIRPYFLDGSDNLIKQTHIIRFEVSGGTNNRGSIKAEIDMLQTIQAISS